jgi:aspartyl-tRNA synthetase
VSAATSRNQLDALTDRAKKIGAKGLVWMRVGDAGVLDSPVAKFLSDDEKAAIVAATDAQPGDVLYLVADDWAMTCEVLGQLRNDLGRPPVHQGPYRYVWIVDFRCSSASTRSRHAQARPSSVHAAAPRRHRPPRKRADVGAFARV